MAHATEQIVQYPKYIDAVRFAVQRHYSLLSGKGKVSGKRFASLIREKCDMANPMNQDAAALAEIHIDNIELYEGGQVKWQFK